MSLRMRSVEVEVRRACLRPAQLDHLVGARLGQIGGQVDVEATKFGKMLTLVRILTLAVL